MTGKNKNIHVVPHPEGWATKTAGSTKAGSVHGRQSDAINTAIPTAKRRRSEVVIHRSDGRIRDKDSYGNDPFPPRDKKY